MLIYLYKLKQNSYHDKSLPLLLQNAAEPGCPLFGQSPCGMGRIIFFQGVHPINLNLGMVYDFDVSTCVYLMIL